MRRAACHGRARSVSQYSARYARAALLQRRSGGLPSSGRLLPPDGELQGHVLRAPDASAGGGGREGRVGSDKARKRGRAPAYCSRPCVGGPTAGRRTRACGRPSDVSPAAWQRHDRSSCAPALEDLDDLVAGEDAHGHRQPLPHRLPPPRACHAHAPRYSDNCARVAVPGAPAPCPNQAGEAGEPWRRLSRASSRLRPATAAEASSSGRAG